MKHKDELIADFQQYYGLNIFDFVDDLNGDETTDSINRLSILCGQLPRDSRLMTAISPALAWSDETYMLARVDYMLRVIAWMFSEDGSKGINQPQPIATPAEIANATAIAERTEDDFEFVDSILNIKHTTDENGGEEI